MKRRTEQFLLKQGALLVLSLTAGACYVFSEKECTISVAIPQAKPAKVTSNINFPSQRDLSAALSGRFFSDPPKPAAPQPSRAENLIVRWPSIEISSVMIGRKSKIVVLRSGQQSFTCSEGDEFLGVSVDKITENGVLLRYKGDSKTIRTTSRAQTKSVPMNLQHRMSSLEVKYL